MPEGRLSAYLDSPKGFGLLLLVQPKSDGLHVAGWLKEAEENCGVLQSVAVLQHQEELFC